MVGTTRKKRLSNAKKDVERKSKRRRILFVHSNKLLVYK